MLSLEDSQEAFLKAVPPAISDVEIIYPVSSVLSEHDMLMAACNVMNPGNPDHLESTYDSHCNTKMSAQ